jgi:hypothetical protein
MGLGQCQGRDRGRGRGVALAVVAAVAAVAVVAAVAAWLRALSARRLRLRLRLRLRAARERFDDSSMTATGQATADRYMCRLPVSGAEVPTDALVMHSGSTDATPMCVFVRGADGLLTTDDGATCVPTPDAPSATRDTLNPLLHSSLVGSVTSQMFQGQQRCVLTFADANASAADAAKLAADMTQVGAAFRAGLPGVYNHYDPIVKQLQDDLVAVQEQTKQVLAETAATRVNTADMRSQMYGPSQQYDPSGNPTTTPTSGIFQKINDTKAEIKKCNDAVAGEGTRQTMLATQLSSCGAAQTQATAAGAAQTKRVLYYMQRALTQGSYTTATPGCMGGKTAYLQKNPGVTTDAWGDWLMNGQAKGAWPGSDHCYVPQNTYVCPDWKPVFVGLQAPNWRPKLPSDVPEGAQWISGVISTDAPRGTWLYNYVFDNVYKGPPIEVVAYYSCDESAIVYCNAKAVSGVMWGPTWQRTFTAPMSLAYGLNTIAVEVANSGGPTGLMLAVVYNGAYLFGTDKTWNYKYLG